MCMNNYEKFELFLSPHVLAFFVDNGSKACTPFFIPTNTKMKHTLEEMINETVFNFKFSSVQISRTIFRFKKKNYANTYSEHIQVSVDLMPCMLFHYYLMVFH